MINSLVIVLVLLAGAEYDESALTLNDGKVAELLIATRVAYVREGTALRKAGRDVVAAKRHYHTQLRTIVREILETPLLITTHGDYYHATEAAITLHEQDTAISFLDAGVKVYPKSVVLRRQLIRVLLSKGDYEAAWSTFAESKQVVPNPKAMDSMHGAFFEFLRQKDPPKARAHLYPYITWLINEIPQNPPLARIVVPVLLDVLMKHSEPGDASRMLAQARNLHFQLIRQINSRANEDPSKRALIVTSQCEVYNAFLVRYCVSGIDEFHAWWLTFVLDTLPTVDGLIGLEALHGVRTSMAEDSCLWENVHMLSACLSRIERVKLEKVTDGRVRDEILSELSKIREVISEEQNRRRSWGRIVSQAGPGEWLVPPKAQLNRRVYCIINPLDRDSLSAVKDLRAAFKPHYTGVEVIGLVPFSPGGKNGGRGNSTFDKTRAAVFSAIATKFVSDEIAAGVAIIDIENPECAFYRLNPFSVAVTNGEGRIVGTVSGNAVHHQQTIKRLLEMKDAATSGEVSSNQLPNQKRRSFRGFLVRRCHRR